MRALPILADGCTWCYYASTEEQQILRLNRKRDIMKDKSNVLFQSPDGIRLEGFEQIKDNGHISIKVSRTTMAIVPEKALGAKMTIKLKNKSSTDAAFIALVQKLCPKEKTYFFYLAECNCYFQYP